MQIAEMNWIDIIIAILMVIVGIKGVFNGFFKEISGLLGIVFGIWGGTLYAAPLGEWLGHHLFTSIDSVSALHMIGFLTLLFIIWLLCLIVGAILAKKMPLSHFGMLDNLLGFLFASLKLFIILSVIVYALSTIEIVQKKVGGFANHSLFYPYMIKTGSYLMHIDTQKVKRSSSELKKEVVNTLAHSAHTLLNQHHSRRDGDE
jgi:membrane protein required for colicin V production